MQCLPYLPPVVRYKSHTNFPINLIKIFELENEGQGCGLFRWKLVGELTLPTCIVMRCKYWHYSHLFQLHFVKDWWTYMPPDRIAPPNSIEQHNKIQKSMLSKNVWQQNKTVALLYQFYNLIFQLEVILDFSVSFYAQFRLVALQQAERPK